MGVSVYLVVFVSECMRTSIHKSVCFCERVRVRISICVTVSGDGERGIRVVDFKYLRVCSHWNATIVDICLATTL